MQAAIFDLDGLLIDSEPLQLRAINRALVPVGVRLTEADWMGYVGTRSIEIITRLRAAHGFEAAPDDIEAAKLAAYRQIIRQPGALSLMPGVHAALAACRASGLTLAIASSSVRGDIAIILDILDLSAAFETITAGDEVTSGKPAPDIFIETARRLAVAPAECLVLEDSPHGVAAANTAGMLSVAIPNRFTARQDFSDAAVVLHDLLEFSRRVAQIAGR